MLQCYIEWLFLGSLERPKTSHNQRKGKICFQLIKCFICIVFLLLFFTFYYLMFTKSLKHCQCHKRNLLVWRQGRFSDPRGRLPGGRDLDAGHRDPQPEEVLHPRRPLQAGRTLAEQGYGADLCCRLQACHITS